MNLKQSSLILSIFNWIAKVIQNSLIARIWCKVLNIWDELVSGSVILNWFTGKDSRPKNISGKPSFLGAYTSLCWSSFLHLIRNQILWNKGLSQSKYLGYIFEFGVEISANPLASVGWFGASFFGLYGILKLQFVGISVTMLVFVVVFFVFFTLLTFAKVPLSNIIDHSWILARLDEIDD